MDVSVLVPVRNEEAHVVRAIEGMLAQRVSGSYELLLIDGESEDATRSLIEGLAQRDPRVRLLSNPERRIPNALNIGLSAARGTYLARMDAHTFYPPDYLENGVRRLAEGDAVWVSGPQIAKGEGVWSSRVALALGTRLGIGGARFRMDAGAECEVDSGFTGVWARETLLAHGGWDEDWTVNEDGELAARIRRKGGRILCIPEMAARYVPRDGLRPLARQYWRYGVFRVKTVRRHPDTMRRSHVLGPAFTLAVAGSVVGPAPIRRAARPALGAYVVAVAATMVQVARSRRPSARDLASLPAVFLTMHAAWGAGFLRGCVRFGVPWAALRGLAGKRRRL